MKIACALTFVGAAYGATSFATQVGETFGDLNRGFCLAFQDNQNDKETTCYQSCDKTAAKILTAFDAEQYSGKVFNSGDMMTYLQNAGMQLMTQFQDCKTTEFLFSLDNRLSDTAFVSGSIANLATQVTTLLAYRSFSADSSGAKNIYNDLAENHAMNKVVENLKSTVTKDVNGDRTVDYSLAGKYLTNFMLSVVNFKAPNVNTGLKPK